MRKEYGNQLAVAGISLEIKDGEFLVFVGPSGSGKTTTLRMMAGLEEPTNGEIVIGGRQVNDVEPRDRNLGMVFQNLALFPHMTVHDNIAFGLRMKKVSPAERSRQVQKVAAMVRISHLLAKLPGQLSGGEAQRVALARTLITNPEAFLLDEPLSNLDAKLRKEMRVEIDRLHQELGKTFIYVTHDQEEAMTLADRIVVMRDGRIEQIGSPVEIYHDPANRFVANFFGSPPMNLIDGKLELREAGMVFVAKGLALPDPRSAGSYAGRVTLGIRPEHVRIVTHAGGIRAELTLLEPLGKETLLYLDFGGETLIVALAEGDFTGAERETISFALPPEKLYFFDADGRRIR